MGDLMMALTRRRKGIAKDGDGPSAGAGAGGSGRIKPPSMADESSENDSDAWD
jgi:hypothetical protein